MTRFAKLLLALVAAVSFGCWCSAAFADGGASADPSSPQNVAMLWPMVAMALAGSWAYAQRKWFSAAGGWWHGAGGHVFIVGVGVVVDAITPIVQHYRGGFHGFPWVALAWSAVGGLLNALAAANASVPMGEKPPMHPDNVTLKAAGLIFPLLFVGALAGCATPGGQALGRCELGQLPQTLEVAIAQIAAIASQPSGWEADLENLGKGLAPGQLGCVEQAIAAALPASSPHLAQVRERLKAHAARHPGACRDLPPDLQKRVGRALERVQRAEERLQELRTRL